MNNRATRPSPEPRSPSDDCRRLLHEGFFHPALRDVLPDHGVSDDTTPHYVASVLIDFCHSRALGRLKQRVLRRHRRKGVTAGYLDTLNRLSQIYIEDLERTILDGDDPAVLLEGHRLIGDYALFMLGMFPAQFNETVAGRPAHFDRTRYLEKGAGHYAWADACYEPWKTDAAAGITSRPFTILADKFAQIVDAVNECNQRHWNRWGDDLVVDPLLRKAYTLLKDSEQEQNED